MPHGRDRHRESVLWVLVQSHERLVSSLAFSKCQKHDHPRFSRHTISSYQRQHLQLAAGMNKMPCVQALRAILPAQQRQQECPKQLAPVPLSHDHVPDDRLRLLLLITAGAAAKTPLESINACVAGRVWQTLQTPVKSVMLHSFTTIA